MKAVSWVPIGLINLVASLCCGQKRGGGGSILWPQAAQAADVWRQTTHCQRGQCTWMDISFKSAQLIHMSE